MDGDAVKPLGEGPIQRERRRHARHAYLERVYDAVLEWLVSIGRLNRAPATGPSDMEAQEANLARLVEMVREGRGVE